MHSNRPKLPLEVATWMEKDISLKKVTANSRLLTNDTRQNIILSRHFFTDLFNLSFTRHRTVTEFDSDKKMFLLHQYKKAKTSMPGLLPYVTMKNFFKYFISKYYSFRYLDQLTSGKNRPAISGMQINRKTNESFICSSTQSFYSGAATKSDVGFVQRQPSSIRQIKTAQIIKPRPDTTPLENSSTSTTSQRRPAGRQITRDKLNRLAQPKRDPLKRGPVDHVRSFLSEPTAEDIFGKIETGSPRTTDHSKRKSKTIVHDDRFVRLVDAFSEVHNGETENSPTFKNIVEANTSLQDDKGYWKLEHPSILYRKTEENHHRQTLAAKLNSKIDIFLIEVGA